MVRSSHLFVLSNDELAVPVVAAAMAAVRNGSEFSQCNMT
jgi:hypothetical protein